MEITVYEKAQELLGKIGTLKLEIKNLKSSNLLKFSTGDFSKSYDPVFLEENTVLFKSFKQQYLTSLQDKLFKLQKEFDKL